MCAMARQVVVDVVACGLAVGFLGCAHPSRRVSPPQPLPRGPGTAFSATAYSGGGRTASGTVPQQGIVAADPTVLPMGSRIRVQAGEYSGDYTVRDTGGAIRGRKIDVYLPKHAQAKRFGRRTVKVQVLTYGPRDRAGCPHCRRATFSQPKHHRRHHHRARRRHHLHRVEP